MSLFVTTFLMNTSKTNEYSGILILVSALYNSTCLAINFYQDRAHALQGLPCDLQYI